MTHPLFNYVHMQEVAPCSQPLNYQPHTAGTLQRLALACCKDSAKPCSSSVFTLSTGSGVFFFWTHFRLSLWMTTYLRMRRTTPSVYLDLCEVRVDDDRAKRLPGRLWL